MMAYLLINLYRGEFKILQKEPVSNEPSPYFTERRKCPGSRWNCSVHVLGWFDWSWFGYTKLFVLCSVQLEFIVFIFSPLLCLFLLSGLLYDLNVNSKK